MNISPNKTDRSRSPRKILYTLVTIFVLAVVVDLSLERMLAQRFRNEQEVSVTHELGAIRARLEERLNTNLFLINGMTAYISIQSGITSEEFDSLAGVLLSQSNSLKNIGAAPDFIIKYVYPLEGNEEVIGLDYRTVPDQWPQALAARESGLMAVAGPLNLVQGGQGLIARVPVFTGADREFWGLVSSVLDFDELVEQTGLKVKGNRLNIGIRGKDGEGDSGKIFWGDPGLFVDAAEAITMSVSLPSGSWQMAAVPADGWKDYSPYRWLIHLSVLFIAIAVCLSAVNRIRSKQALIESENRLKAMSVASLDALIMIDTDDTIMFWNPAAESMFGYSESEVIGKKLHSIVVDSQQKKKALVGLAEFAKTGKGPVLDSVLEMEAVRKSGEIFPVERSVASFKLKDKWYAVGSVRDITDRKQSEEMLITLATTDALTGLSNRRHFLELSKTQFRQAVRYRKKFSLMMFDLDHFKKINDTYGHDAGDRVLQAVAASVKRELRDTDIVGRIGGEEFAVAMPETDLSAAKAAAERIRLGLMETKVKTESHTIGFTVSIGVTHLDSREIKLSDMMKMADEALYKAKNSGRNRVVTTS